MRKIIFSIITAAAFLVSCTSSEVSVTTASASLTESVKSYVSSNYPDVTVDAITVSDNTATAILSSGEALIFDLHGSFVKYSNNACYGISTDSLYVTTDSTEVTNDTVSNGKHHHGHHENHSGNTSGKGDSGHHGNPNAKHHDNDMSVDSLATVINDYIVANYAGYTVTHASIDTICSGSVINVMVCDSITEPIKLVFDAAGTFLMSGKRITYTEVPVTVSDAVTAGFATYTVSKRCSIYTLADGTIEYKVYLKASSDHIWVMFAADGTVVCQK